MRKLKRLRQMTANEIAYRLRERMRIEAERARLRLRPPRPGADLDGAARLPAIDGSFKAYLEMVAGSRFYFPAPQETRESLRSFVEATFPEWVENSIVEAESICSRRIELFGHGEIQLDPALNWHRDPVTRRVWPVRFWANYDPVADDRFGDVKTVHELNRHQFLTRLGKAFFFTGQDRYAREALSLIDSWIEQNPQGQGVNWQSSLEIGIRVLSWLWTLFFILPSGCLDERLARRIGHSLIAQLRHLAAYPSVYSSPNTHLIGEAAALFIAGSLFPEMEEGAAWRRMGSSLLIEQAGVQVLPDGVYAEMSTCYHCYALDFFLQALLMARRLDDPFPHSVWHTVERMLEYLMHVAQPGGAIPLVGDDDGGRALALESTDYRSFRDALSTGVVLFCRSDFKHLSGGFHQETLWTTGEEGYRIYRAVRGCPPRELGRGFPQAGHYIQRSGWEPRDSQLVFDCGGMGILNGGHAHADALSIVLSAHGAPLLIDPGTFVYNAAAPWRTFFRSTAAHNTATVDGRDQSDMAGTFAWGRRAPARLLNRFLHAGVEFLEAEHDGYNTGPDGLIHRRRLLFCPSGYWVIADDFRASEPPSSSCTAPGNHEEASVRGATVRERVLRRNESGDALAYARASDGRASTVSEQGVPAGPAGSSDHLFEFYYHLPAGAELGLHEAEGGPVNLLVRSGPGGLLLYFDAMAQISAGIRCGETAPIQGWSSRRYGDRRPSPVLHAAFAAPLPVAALSVAVPFPTGVETHFPPEPTRVDCIEGALACAIEQDRFVDYAIVGEHAAPLEFLDSRFSGEFFWMRTRGGALTQLVAVNARYFIYRGLPVFEWAAPAPYVSALFSGDRVVLHCGEAQDKVYVRNLRNLEFRSI